MSNELTGGRTNYYLVRIDHPQREDQAPYQAECEDIADALGLTPNEFCEFKAIWRTAAARLGNGKPDHKALYDAQKRVHYATRDLLKLEREFNAPKLPEAVPDGTVVDDGWITHNSNEMPFPLDKDDLVEVRLASGIEYVGNFAKSAADWVWVDDGMHTRVTHYRLAKIKQPVDPSPHLWVEHTGQYMPDGLDCHEMVEIKLSNGHETIMAKRADRWDWFYRQPEDQPDAPPHIAAWRRYRHQPC